MPTELYNVRFYGKIAEGRTPEEVKHQLITRFKVPAKQLEEAFAGKPFFIKMKVDRQSALKYKAAFEQSGALCAIEPVSQAPKTRQPASSKTSNISNQSGSTEFSTEFYNVKFYGKIAEGQTVEGVNHQLATRFKIPAKLLEEAFLGKPFFIKDKVDYQTALKYKAAFEQAGALCSIEPVSQTPTRQRPPHVPPVPPLVSGKEVSAPETQPQLVNCPNCGLKQKQALKCTRCEAFLKQPVKNQTDEATQSERKFPRQSPAEYPRRSKQEEVPLFKQPAFKMGIGGAVAVVLGVLLITLIGRDSSSWYQGEWVVDAEKTMTMEHSQATDEQLQEFAQKFLEAMETAMEFKITGDEIMRGAAGMGDKYKIREKYKVLIKGEDWITIEIEKPFRIEGSQENARTTAKIYRDGDGIRIEESATIGEGTSVLYLKRK